MAAVSIGLHLGWDTRAQAAASVLPLASRLCESCCNAWHVSSDGHLHCRRHSSSALGGRSMRRSAVTLLMSRQKGPSLCEERGGGRDVRGRDVTVADFETGHFTYTLSDIAKPRDKSVGLCSWSALAVAWPWYVKRKYRHGIFMVTHSLRAVARHISRTSAHKGSR